MTGIFAEHLNASLQVIGVNAGAYYSGSLHVYRPIAAELRKLLCDTQSGRDISLLPQCFPGMRLHPLLGTQSMIDEHTVLYIPARMRFDGAGGSDVQTLFNESGDMLSVPEWLDQKLFSYNVTLRDFIRSVADKEGAHADKDMNNALKLTKGVFFPRDETLAAKATVAIARYIVNGCAIRASVVAERAESLVRTKANQLGRGIHVLDLHKFCHYGAHAFPMDFVPELNLSDMSPSDEPKMTEIQNFVASYDPRKEFLLMTIDLNRKDRNVYALRF